MPKSAKKRKEKAADFSKAKLKLGKGKQLANNAVDTSFKARSIALPSQSIAVEKDSKEPTTKRRLTFDDLIAHLSHHNVGARRDAILGLKELFESHPDLLDSSLTTLISACVRMFGDEDGSVRKTLLVFLTWLLPRIPQENLTPHSPLLLLFATSAQTHIYPEIRIDAIHFLDLFLEYIPDEVVTGWTEVHGGHGTRVLEGYLGILNAGTIFGESDGPIKATSTASVVLSTASKLIVLKSLSTFLQNALSSPCTKAETAINLGSLSIPTWYLVPSFTNHAAYESFDRLLQPVLSRTSSLPRCWKEKVGFEAGDGDFVGSFELLNGSSKKPWSLAELLNTTTSVSHGEVDQVRDIVFFSHLARTLHPILISTFLDCAPIVFAPGTNVPETEAQLITAVGEIARCLYGAILRGSTTGPNDSAVDQVRALLGYMRAYFPFRPNRSDIKLENAFQSLNIIYCELISLLVLSSWNTSTNHDRISGKKPRRGHGPQLFETKLSVQTEVVSDFVIRLLKGEAVTSQLGRSLTPTAYVALLPTIWSLLNSPVTDGQDQPSVVVLQNVVEHATKTSSKSALKQFTIEFLARIILLETESQFQGNFMTCLTSEETAKLREWINHLPQTLWELGVNNLATTEIIFRFLLRLFQRKSSLVHSEIIVSIRLRLVPYFSITHAVHGQLLGPYSKLTGTGLRKLALDTVATVMSFGGRCEDRLESAVEMAVTGTEERQYWSDLTSLLPLTGHKQR